MLRIAAAFVFVALAIGLAAPAVAGEVVEGDGYRFRLPEGFTPLAAGAVCDVEEAQQALDTMNSMLSSFMEVDMKLFVRQRGTDPDAVVMVFAIHLEDEMADAMRSQMNLDQLEAQLRAAQAELNGMGVPAKVGNIQRIQVGARQAALEVHMTLEDPTIGDLTSAHMLFVIDDTTMCMLGLQGVTANEVEDRTHWRSMVSSFRLQPRETIWTYLFRYGPFALGGIAILLAVVVMRRSGRTSERGRASVPSRDPQTLGLSRAFDGLPTYGGAQAALLGTNGTAPATARVDAVPSPGRVVAPTIPRAASREIEVVDTGVPGNGLPLDAHAAEASQSPPSVPGPSVRPPLRPPVIPRSAPAPGGAALEPETSPHTESVPSVEESPASPLGLLASAKVDALPAVMPTNVAQRESIPPEPPANAVPSVGEALECLDPSTGEPANDTMPVPPATVEVQDALRFQRNRDFLG